MPKKSFKKKKNFSKKFKNSEAFKYPVEQRVLENKDFEFYYRKVFKDYFQDTNEFELFYEILKQKLPVTFRINASLSYYQKIIHYLKDPKFIEQIIEIFKLAQEKKQQQQAQQKPQADQKNEIGQEEQKTNTKPDINSQEVEKQNAEELIKSLLFEAIPWYPNELAWKLNIDRKGVRKNQDLKAVHNFLNDANESGLITRQEIVSFLPPLFLDVKHEDKILDICAAPGSKTAELIDMMEYDQIINKKNDKTQGFIIANDADADRVSLLNHQLNRLPNIEFVMTTNHEGQHFPSFTGKTNENIEYFDKILCDVPCSSDGALRKIQLKWAQWSNTTSMNLHHLQIKILMQSLKLVKVGGLVLYSTCSLNPIEDEAVLTEVFRKCGYNSIELIDIHDKLPGLKARKGLNTWPVLEHHNKKIQNQLELVSQYKDVEQNNNFLIFNSKESYMTMKDKHDILNSTISMFPEDIDTMDNKIKIAHSMRILPHDQDSGGFFLALIKKKAEILDKDKPFLQKETSPSPKTEPLQEQIKKINKTDNQLLQENVLSNPNNQMQTEEVGFQTKKIKLREDFDTIEDNDWQEIQKSFGITDETFKQRLFYQKGSSKRILYFSESLKKLFDSGIHYLRKELVGSTVFKRQREKYENLSSIRLTQFSILKIMPFFKKNIIRVKFEDFVKCVGVQNVDYSQIDNPEFKTQLQNLGIGPFILYFSEILPLSNNEETTDALACLNFKNSFCIMCPKEQVASFKFRYQGVEKFFK